jgi:WD40 repeat protein
VIDGSLSSDMLCMDNSVDGQGLATGSGDREVKLWNYDEGHCYYVGLGHSAPVTKVKCKQMPNLL